MSIVTNIKNEIKKFRRLNKKIKQEYIYKYDENGEIDESNLNEFNKTRLAEELKDEEFKNRIEELIRKLFKEFADKDDVYAYNVFEQIVENTYLQETRDLNIKVAAELGLPVKEVENANKRIRRLANKIRL